MSEKDFGELIKFIFQVPGAVAVIFFAVKWVVSDWFKKNSEIQVLKSQIKNQEVDTLKERVRDLEHLIKEYMSRTVTHSNQIEVAQRGFNHAVIKMDEYSAKTTHVVQEYAKLTHERLVYLEKFNNELREKMKANVEKSEKLNLGKETVMFKTKKEES